jgi:formamidopyrimidine-DNA glycosylase
MPELPEVETIRRGLVSAMQGRRIVSVTLRRGDLRFPLPERFAERLEGRRVQDLARRAKYLLAHLDNADTLLVHLGMSGRITVLPRAGRARRAVRDGQGEGAHDHVIFAMENGTRIVYADPRRFGMMDLVAARDLDRYWLLKDLGAEPLGEGFHSAYLAHALHRRRTSLKAALLDQRTIAGLGNIYACEALFRAGLSPRRIAATVAPKGRPTLRSDAIVAAVRSVLTDALAAGGSTLRDYARADGTLGYFQHAFEVYDREGHPCPRPGCGGTVKRIVQGARASYFCPRCQR